jgi:hypothetical protein
LPTLLTQAGNKREVSKNVEDLWLYGFLWLFIGVSENAYGFGWLFLGFFVVCGRGAGWAGLISATGGPPAGTGGRSEGDAGSA